MKKCIIGLIMCILLSSCAAQTPAGLSPSSPENPAVSGTLSQSPPEPGTVIPEILRSVLKGAEAPTDEQREEMAQKMGTLGFSVLRYNENMLNYEPVAKFFEQASAGINGEVTVYTYPYSYVAGRTFSFQNRQLTCAYTMYTSEGARTETARNVDEFSYTKKGNLIYRTEGNSEKECFRVLPLSEESRAYYRKYLVPVNTFSQGPLQVTWNSRDFSRLNWEWIFDVLWRFEKGAAMVDPASPYYQKAPDHMGFDKARFPAGVMEGLLQKYFDVPAATLKKLAAYDAKTETYTFQGFNGGGYSPTLEVSKWRDNPDGSLTLWIDFVALELGKELAAQSKLTVMPARDGSFKYLSNVYETH